jgi:hypothetical protein
MKAKRQEYYIGTELTGDFVDIPDHVDPLKPDTKNQ